MLKTYKGSCHCGAVRFEADLDLTQPTFRCNCSICRRTRQWAAVAMPDRFRLLSGEGGLVEYLFNRKKNQHFFCQMYGVNIGCLEGVSEEELSKIPVTRVDGMHDRMEEPEFGSHL
jgi:hypothetical protein